MGTPAIQKGMDAIASSLNYIGGTIGNAFEVCFLKVFVWKMLRILNTSNLQLKSHISCCSFQSKCPSQPTILLLIMPLFWQ